MTVNTENREINVHQLADNLGLVADLETKETEELICILEEKSTKSTLKLKLLLAVLYYQSHQYYLVIDQLKIVETERIESQEQPIADVYKFLALAYTRVDKFKLARKNWKIYAELVDNIATQELQSMVEVFTRLGNYKTAKKYYKQISFEDKKPKIWDYLFEQNQVFLATQILEDYVIKAESPSPKTIYKLGVYYMHLFDYEQAAKYVILAIKDNPNQAYSVRLASIYERMGQYQLGLDACDNFDFGEEKIKYSRVYLQANLYAKNNQIKQAADCFFNNDPHIDIKRKAIINNVYYIQAKTLEDSGDYLAAAEMYQNVVYSYNQHYPYIFTKIGEMYYLAGDWTKAVEYYLQYNIQTEYPLYASEREGQYQNVTMYSHLYDNLPVNQNHVVYTAFSGRSFTGNVYAIFKQMLKQQGLIHFVVVNSRTSVPEAISNLDNVHIVIRNSYLHYRSLATAKYIITNSTNPYAYACKPEQKILSTWYGTPITAIGFNKQNNKYIDSRNIKNTLESATHSIYPNQFTKDVIEQSFALNSQYSGHSIIGYPRLDLLLNISPERIREIRQNLELDATKKTVLYSPLNREQDEDQEEYYVEQIERLIEHFESMPDINFICNKKTSNPEKYQAARALDPTELLAVVDVLITDYSDIAIDYLVTEKPLVLYPFDKQQIEDEIGLNISLETLTDAVADNLQTVTKLVSEGISAVQSSKVQLAAKEVYCQNADGQASKRATAFLKADNQVKTSSKKSILMYAGNFLKTNGMSVSFQNFINNLDLNKYELTILIQEGILNQDLDEELIDWLIKKQINICYYYGTVSKTVDEDYAIKLFSRDRQFYSDYHQQLCQTAMARNAKRLFGNKKFDTILDFGSGYAFSVNMQLALSECDNKLIVLHNDMFAEMELRFPRLRASFHLYKYFDKLLTVSDNVSQSNISELANRYDIDTSKFSTLFNFMDYQKVLTNSTLPLEVASDEQYFGRFNTYISIGRYSPEKNHKLLIDAFSIRLKNFLYRNDKLLIVGYGPLEAELKQYILSLGLENNVILTGRRENPYNYLKRCKAMLLPSLHEGQSLVLLEALILNVPYLATDTPAPREIFQRFGGGLLTTNEPRKFSKDMKAIKRSMRKNNYNPQQYNQNIKQYLEQIL